MGPNIVPMIASFITLQDVDGKKGESNSEKAEQPIIVEKHSFMTRKEAEELQITPLLNHAQQQLKLLPQLQTLLLPPEKIENIDNPEQAIGSAKLLLKDCLKDIFDKKEAESVKLAQLRHELKAHQTALDVINDRFNKGTKITQEDVDKCEKNLDAIEKRLLKWAGYSDKFNSLHAEYQDKQDALVKKRLLFKQAQKVPNLSADEMSLLKNAEKIFDKSIELTETKLDEIKKSASSTKDKFQGAMADFNANCSSLIILNEYLGVVPDKDKPARYESKSYKDLKVKIQSLQNEIATQVKITDNYSAEFVKVSEPLTKTIVKKESLSEDESQSLMTSLKPMIAEKRAYYDALVSRLQSRRDLAAQEKYRDISVPITAPENKWPKNFMIGASSGQLTSTYEMLFVESLADKMKMTDSLPEALLKTESENAYVIQSYVKDQKIGEPKYVIPVCSSNMGAEKIFQKDEKRPTNRIVITIQGEGGNRKNNDLLTEGVSAFKKSMTDNYSLENGNNIKFIDFDRCDLKQIDDTFDALSKADPELAKNTEVVIFIAGHGSKNEAGDSEFEEGLDVNMQKMEGGRQGNIALKEGVYLDEAHLKEKCRQLSHYRGGLVIANACQSGYLVAKADGLNNKVNRYKS